MAVGWKYSSGSEAYQPDWDSVGFKINSLDSSHSPMRNGAMVYFPRHLNRALLMSDSEKLSLRGLTLLAPHLNAAFLKLRQFIQAVLKGHWSHPHGPRDKWFFFFFFFPQKWQGVCASLIPQLSAWFRSFYLSWSNLGDSTNGWFSWWTCSFIYITRLTVPNHFMSMPAICSGLNGR